MKNIISHPESFKSGFRILMLTLRSKDGGKKNNPDRVSKKFITSSPEEYDKVLTKLIATATGDERIYATIDERDMKKGIMLFKHRQLDADYFDQPSHFAFYTDIYNRWISALQSPPSRVGTLFLVDIDNDEENGQNVGQETKIRNEITSQNIEIVHEYPTKSGIHIITKPFNPSVVSFSIQKNAMMLLAY